MNGGNGHGKENANADRFGEAKPKVRKAGSKDEKTDQGDPIVTPKRSAKSVVIDGWAKDFIRKHGPIICKADRWWIWNKKIWEPIDRKTMPARETYRMLPTDNKSSKCVSAILDAVNIICQKTDDEVKLRGAIWNEKDCLFINLANGTCVLSKNTDGEVEMEFTGHAIIDHSTAYLPFDYDAEAKCPTFDYLLSSCLPDMSDQELLQFFLGYCLIPDHRFQCMLYAHGRTNCGKSTLILEGAGSVFGDKLMTNVSLEKICAAGDELRDLEISLVNISSEINKRNLKDSDMFNKVICGESSNAALKYDKSRKVMPQCKYIGLGNHMPRWDRGDEAQARRIKILSFTKDFTKEAKDNRLKEAVKKEQAGIFNWMLEGLSKALVMPQMPNGGKQSQKQGHTFRANNNPIGEFLRTRVELGKEGFTSTKDFANAFRIWCEEKDISRTFMDERSIGRCLSQNYPDLDNVRIRVNGILTRGFKGMRLNLVSI